MTPILEVRGVSQRYGNSLVLQDINLSIYPGERVALLGSSGAGKSTLLQLLNGALIPTTGEVWAFGKLFTSPQQPPSQVIQRQIGTIYQQFHLIDSLKVIHNVNAGHLGRWPWYQALWSLLWPQEVERATLALAQVGIADKLYTRTDQLSGGQQQRVALARVLIQDPRLILADEPIASLDPELSREVMQLLTQIINQEDKSLVVSLHLPEYAERFCNRCIGLRQGRIVLDTEYITPQQITELYALTDV